MFAANGEGILSGEGDENAVRQLVDVAAVPPFGAAVEAFGVQNVVHRRRAGARPVAGKFQREVGCFLAPALEAGPVPGRERGHLVEEEQFGVVAPPDIALAALETQHAADPLPAGMAALAERAIVAMEFAAAIAEQRSARLAREQFTEGVDAVGQRHGIPVFRG